MQNETGSREEKWHKTDTRGSASVRGQSEKENAAPDGPRNGITSKQKSAFSATRVSTTGSNLEAESPAPLHISERMERLDRAVLAAFAKPDGHRRNGMYCFARRSRIAREVGVRRDVLNAAIRRLTEAGKLRPVYSSVLARWGLEIWVEPTQLIEGGE
ncbi:MAG: hypothetical protein K5905_23215 [Roseibium sp.]|uniref:hypothetical protein n=1 Tax=Roseibium sp. TaxID=1936156 RepID=UPI002609412A|nr:hypothetical protein [Roseibium sp.]MCV0428378.1 hypothetical protein [Roseibium sp.]